RRWRGQRCPDRLARRDVRAAAPRHHDPVGPHLTRETSRHRTPDRIAVRSLPERYTRRVITADLIVEHARQLIPCAGPAPRRGKDQGQLTVISDGAVASAAGRIVFVGKSDDLSRAVE